MNEVYECCFCHKHFKGYGNNPEPIIDNKHGKTKCCDVCNFEIVIPARMRFYSRKAR